MQVLLHVHVLRGVHLRRRQQRRRLLLRLLLLLGGRGRGSVVLELLLVLGGQRRETRPLLFPLLHVVLLMHLRRQPGKGLVVSQRLQASLSVDLNRCRLVRR